MKTVKQLREQLDFSQAEMAKYLGITRSALAMSERGHPLNAEALMKFAVLEDYVKKVTGTDSRNELPDNDVKEFARTYEVQEQVYTLKADLLERKLNELQKMFDHNHQAYNVLKEMWSNKAGDLKWLNEQRKKVDAKIRMCSEKVRKEMSDQIVLLRKTAATYRQFLEESLIL